MLGKESIYQAFHKYKTGSSIVVIPFSEFECSDFRLYEWYALEINRVLNTDMECFVFADYRTSCIYIVIKESNMQKFNFTIEIPYQNHDEYIDFVREVNRMVSDNAVILIFVNNIVYNLKAYICIEDDYCNSDKIISLIKKFNLTINTKKGHQELICEAGLYRKYNFSTIPKEDEDIELVFSRMFLYKSESKLRESGYNINQNIERKKVFISYCHADKTLVYDIVDILENSGVNLWIDKKSIDVGDNILRAILSGIWESDLAVLFISRATLNSNFAQNELENIMSEMVKKRMCWYIVKLDDVNPDDVLNNLGNYKYYDFSLDKDVSLLVNDIIKKIGKI